MVWFSLTSCIFKKQLIQSLSSNYVYLVLLNIIFYLELASKREILMNGFMWVVFYIIKFSWESIIPLSEDNSLLDFDIKLFYTEL